MTRKVTTLEEARELLIELCKPEEMKDTLGKKLFYRDLDISATHILNMASLEALMPGIYENEVAFETKMWIGIGAAQLQDIRRITSKPLTNLRNMI